jgi:hypothetical protein
MHCNKHVVKMIVETAQLLSTAHHVLDGHGDGLYKMTHKNHPSAIWCRQTDSNYVWLWCLLVSLCKEYTHRYGKIHKCQYDGLVGRLLSLPTNIKRGDFTPPTPAMPDEYKTADVIQSYRNYYNGSKASFAKWTDRPTPEWFNG